MIRKRLSEFKTRLTSIGDGEPLNKLSLTAVIILDFIILAFVFQGLEDHTRQLTSVQEYIPRVTQNIFINELWSPADRVSKLQPLILTDRSHYNYRYASPFESEKLEQMHPLCKEFYDQVKTLSQDKPLRDLFVARKNLANEHRKIRRSFEKAKKAYDTHLLENIAAKTPAPAQSLEAASKEHTAELDSLTASLAAVERKINAHPGIVELWAFITPEQTVRQEIIDDFKRFQFWYPLKELGWQLLFILPIFAAFYAWNAHSIKKNNPIQLLISSHLLVIASLPIILKMIELAIDLIPNHFFKNLFKFLASLHLIAIWHYLVIAGSVALGLFLVFFIQKKMFNRQKVIQKRLMKGCCINCGKNLPAQAANCPFCGTKQTDDCGHCGKQTPIAGLYCIHCGTAKG
jgi:hypothetical protein